MTLHRRLPNVYPEARSLVVTWHLHGSPPASAPHAFGATSAMDCENVHRWPQGSSTVYCRSPKGMSVGGFKIRAAHWRACSQCALTSSTCTVTYWLTSLARGGRNSPPWRPNRAVGSGKLRMYDTATRNRNAKALRETESTAKPVDRLLHVFVDEDEHHCCSRCRPVDYHAHLQTSDELNARGDYARSPQPSSP